MKDWKDLSKRFLVSSIAIILLILLLVFAYNPIFRFCVLAIIAFISVVAVWEFAKIVQRKGIFISPKLLILATFLVVCSFFFSSSLAFVLFFLFSVIVFLNQFQNLNGSISNVAISVFGLLYIAVPMGMFVSILYPWSSFSGDGRWWIAYLLIVTKMVDVAAYFIGKLWGKRKLAKEISPHKTWEGAVGGFLSGWVFSLLIAWLSYKIPIHGWVLTPWEAIFLGSIMGIMGQIGDLAESLFKRDAKLKDSNALPGLGGILDTLDSLLFNIPIVFIFINWS